jgi:hypothetical protein
VAAAFRISALSAPHSKEPPGSRAFPAACLHSTPPRFRLFTLEELHETEAVTSPHSLCDAAPQGAGLRWRAFLIVGVPLTAARICGQTMFGFVAVCAYLQARRLVRAFLLHRKRYERHGTRLCAHAPNPTMHSTNVANTAILNTASIMLPST